MSDTQVVKTHQQRTFQIQRHPEVTRSSDYWDALAPHHSSIENNYFDLPSLRRIVHDIHQPVLVVGAGQGLIVAELRKNGFRSDGVDLSSEMIRYAKTRRGLKFVQADARAMPFGEGTYETIINASGVVDFIGDEEQIGVIMTEATSTDLQTIWGPFYWTGTAQNIAVRLEGRQSTGTLLVMAHYDSVPTGPGAADDGAGTAAMLEILRGLKSTPPLMNDVVAVFTDGEEAGFVGAQAFLDEHPWAKQVRLALALDFSGDCGPAVLFGVTHPNGWLIREFRNAATRARASSLVDAFLPSESVPGDIWPYQHVGIPGTMVSNFGCDAGYHTMADSAENIDQRSIQHPGGAALALIRHFGNMGLKGRATDDVVYFMFLHLLLYYPTRWVKPLGALTLTALLAVLALGLGRKRLTIGRCLLSLLFWVVACLAAFLLVGGIWWAMKAAGLAKPIFLTFYNGPAFGVALLLLGSAIILGSYALFRNRLCPDPLAAGGLLYYTAFLIFTSFAAQGGTYLFLWPLFLGVIAVGGLLLAPPGALTARFVALALAVPITILLVDHIAFNLLGSAGDLQAAVSTIGAGLLLALLAPELEVLTDRTCWTIPLVAGLAGLIALGFAVHGSRYDPRHPRADSIAYWLDSDAGKAAWLSFDKAPDAWTSQFLRGTPERTKFGRLGLLAQLPVTKVEAPALKLPTPEVTVLGDSTDGQSRTLRLRIVSRRQARRVWVEVQNAGVVRGTVNGKPIPVRDADTRSKSWSFLYTALASEGIEVALTMQGAENPEMTVTDQSDGLPEFKQLNVQPRGPEQMPSPWPPFDSTLLVSRTVVFAGTRQQ